MWDQPVIAQAVEREAGSTGPDDYSILGSGVDEVKQLLKLGQTG